MAVERRGQWRLTDPEPEAQMPCFFANDSGLGGLGLRVEG